MMQVTSKIANDISAELLVAARAIAKKHGLEVRVKGGSYNPSEFRPRFEFYVAEVSEDGSVQSAAMLRMAAAIGVDPSRNFHLGGHVLRLVDYNNRARKTPWIAEAVGTGKRYRLQASQFQHLIRDETLMAA